MDTLVLIAISFLAASIGLGIVVTRKCGVLSVRSLVILSILNLITLVAIVSLFAWPWNSPVAVYTIGPIVIALMIVLLSLLPSTLMFWFVRLKGRQ